MSKEIYLIKSRLSGTFYGRLSPEEDPLVEVGDMVDPGTLLCIIETMKVFNDVRSEKKGIIRKILVENEEPVMIHRVLMEIELI